MNILEQVMEKMKTKLNDLHILTLIQEAKIDVYEATVNEAKKVISDLTNVKNEAEAKIKELTEKLDAFGKDVKSEVETVTKDVVTEVEKVV